MRCKKCQREKGQLEFHELKIALGDKALEDTERPKGERHIPNLEAFS